jgi:hypothetical protein
VKFAVSSHLSDAVLPAPLYPLIRRCLFGPRHGNEVGSHLRYPDETGAKPFEQFAFVGDCLCGSDTNPATPWIAGTDLEQLALRVVCGKFLLTAPRLQGI